ncbi:MAG: hypothetical protein AMS26_05510 [Bacteroides sp. SM23_62]|nr:MAG: hypothetical protein AMS26_05510 [Bacteroides sp. SM23_62]
MRTLISASTIIFISLQCFFGQSNYKGIALKNINGYSAGDTVDIFGFKKNSYGKSFYLIGTGFNEKYVSSAKLALLDDDLDYWQVVWLENQSSHINATGWQSDLRSTLRDDFYEYASQMEINGLVFRDEYLEDYLRQLMLIVHPKALIKEIPSRLNILMITAIKPEVFTFDNGTIVITTGMLAKTRSEQELLTILSEQTAHVVLDHNLMNLTMEIRNERSAEFWTAFATIASAVAMEFSNIRYGTDFHTADLVLTGLSAAAISYAIVQSTGADFSSEQKQRAKDLSEAFMYALQQREDFEFLPDKEYMINISSALSLTAWQEYHHHNYDQAMRYMDRVFGLGIANEEDYLLRAKLTRTLSNTYQSNAETLRLINTALAMHDFDFVEALAEKGLILIRLGEVAEAREVFVTYKEAVSEMSNMPPGRNLTWANRMLIKCDQLMQKR